MKSLLAAALFLMMALGVCLGQSEPQSLGDLARQNKPDKKAAVVLTDDDIQSSRGVISVVGDDSDKTGETDKPPASSSSQKKAGEASQAGSTKDDARLAELKKELDSYKKQQASWENSAKKYEDLLASETSDFRRATYQEALDNDKKNVTVFQQKVDQASQELAKAQQQAAAGSKGGQSSSNTPPAGSQP
jgi:DNA repair exonuclease SbcCD ATPase subunit